MTKHFSPQLPLSTKERNRLRNEKIKLADIADMEPERLANVLHTSAERARTLVALAKFQRIPSIGPRFAEDVVALGYYTLEQLKDANGADLFEQLELLRGCWIDPCVEDQFRLIVHYANHPDSTKNWWNFTEERKAYRQKYGYPANRPKVAWNDPFRRNQ